MTTQQTFTPSPVDFGDPTALQLGEFAGGGTIQKPTDAAMRALQVLHGDFDVDRVQFSFNGTPAVVRIGMTAQDVHVDWNERRTAFQKAAGIV